MKLLILLDEWQWVGFGMIRAPRSQRTLFRLNYFNRIEVTR